MPIGGGREGSDVRRAVGSWQAGGWQLAVGGWQLAVAGWQAGKPAPRRVNVDAE